MKNNINWRKIKNIFFVGIKGVGMAPLAVIAKEAGFNIAGSDLAEEFITDELLLTSGIEVFEGFDKKMIQAFFDGKDYDSCLVITTGAHGGYKNPQVLKAKEMGIPFLNHGQAVGAFMSGVPFERQLEGITVTGSHGKTTLSAMLAAGLVSLGLDPSYAVGTSKIFPIGASGHFGKGNFFVAEGDEYVGEPVFDRTAKILYQKPKFAILNNVDFDHPDVYKSIEDIKETMLKFINNLGADSTVFINSDDNNLRELLRKIRKDIKIVTFGEENADFTIKNINENTGSLTFDAYKKGRHLGCFSLSVPGAHNAKNSLAVIAFLSSINTPVADIISSINSYKGCRRRMELVGRTQNGALIIDDYGHHPLEIKLTIDALKKFYNKKIICIFQSHTFSRTKKFLGDFSKSFKGVDELILLPIFKSQRDTEKDFMSLGEFVAPFMANLHNVSVKDGINETVSFLKERSLNDEYIILTIGAGEVYKVGYNLKT